MKKLIFIVVALYFGLTLTAFGIPSRPNPPTLVTDLADVFSANEEEYLERKLVDFFASTSNQIAVVTVSDLEGYDISDMAFRIGADWGIGSEKFDNGILILLKPKTADSNGQAFIAVGYGLEGVVPDITAKQIVENEMIPRFKEGNMFAGIDNAANVLIELAKGEYNYQQYAKKSEGNPLVFFILIGLFIVLPILFGRRRSGFTVGSRNSSLPFWITMGLLNGLGNRSSGSFSDFSRGSGSFGGGGSSFGGFGGFGGGGFGGGGAGGSW
ncbi:MAG: TPM domain-containing protein [Bacteroidales bacterium]|nr:TPM domain-containing protein [Bacteroidales bacterium]